jgi:hypothetical protein
VSVEAKTMREERHRAMQATGTDFATEAYITYPRTRKLDCSGRVHFPWARDLLGLWRRLRLPDTHRSIN